MNNNIDNVETTEKDSRIYEVGYHILPIVSEADLGARVTAVRDAIESSGGSIFADEYPKHMDLAYQMVKVVSNKRATHNAAYFGWMKFEADPDAAKKIDDALKKDDFVLRHILIKTVRENTMVPKKVFRDMRETESRPAEKEVAKPVMTEEELDKTIDELVID